MAVKNGVEENALALLHINNDHILWCVLERPVKRISKQFLMELITSHFRNTVILRTAYNNNEVHLKNITKPIHDFQLLLGATLK